MGMLGEGEGVGHSILVLTEEREMAEGSSSVVLAVGQTMVLGNLKSKWEREKRVLGRVGEGVLLGEAFVGPAKGSSSVRRVVAVEEMFVNYGFLFG
jgi:hypothetical protein